MLIGPTIAQHDRICPMLAGHLLGEWLLLLHEWLRPDSDGSEGRESTLHLLLRVAFNGAEWKGVFTKPRFIP